MSEQIQAAAPVQPATLTVAQAAAQWGAAKAAGRTVDDGAQKGNSISDAARTLGQQSAQARQARQAEAAAAQETAQQPEENAISAPEGETTDPELAPGEQQPEAELTSSETIDIGEGVTLTKAEIRENILRRADYTKKTEEVARERKALETERSQRLSQLDSIIGALQQKIGQPKTLKQWLSDDPIGGLERFADQQEQMAEVNHAHQAKTQAEQHAYSQALDLRDKQLAESYNTAWSDPAKRDADYTAMTAYALKEGASPNEVKMMTSPWMLKVLHKAMLQEGAAAGAENVTKLIAGKPQVVRPGAKVSAQAGRQSAITQATARLQKTGSLADAAAILGLRRAQRG